MALVAWLFQDQCLQQKRNLNCFEAKYSHLNNNFMCIWWHVIHRAKQKRANHLQAQKVKTLTCKRNSRIWVYITLCSISPEIILKFSLFMFPWYIHLHHIYTHIHHVRVFDEWGGSERRGQREESIAQGWWGVCEWKYIKGCCCLKANIFANL